MSRVDTAMSRWLVYAQTHGLLSLDLRVFPPILERLRAYLQVPIIYLLKIKLIGCSVLSLMLQILLDLRKHFSF
jgi:hypothetical protein